MKKTCILLKTRDRRNFLVSERHLDNLIEYAKTFNTEIWKAKTNGKVLNLKSLASNLCNTEYSEKGENFEEVSKIFPPTSERLRQIQNARSIRNFIKKRLLNGNSVSLKELKIKYKSWNLSNSCLSNHFGYVRKVLKKEGHKIEKSGVGEYCLNL